MSCHLIN